MPKIEKKYFVGKTKPGVWASIYAYKPVSGAILEKKGEIFAAISIKGPKEFDSNIAGNLLLDILHETYFESKNTSVIGSLEEAVKETQKRLLSLIENDEVASIEGIDFNLIVLVIKGEFAFSIRVGDGVLKILRNGNLQDLSAGFKDPLGEKKYAILSMPIYKDDRFFIATAETVNAFSEDEIFESLYEFDELNLKNKLIEDDSDIACLLIAIDIVQLNNDEANDIFVKNNIKNTKEVISENELVNVKEKQEEIIKNVQTELNLQSDRTLTQRKFNFEKLLVIIKSVVLKFRNFILSKYFSLRKNRDRSLKKRVTSEVHIDSKLQDDVNKNIKKQESTLKVYTIILLNNIKKLVNYTKVELLQIGRNDKVYVGRRRRELNYRVTILFVVIILVLIVLAIRWRKNAVNQARLKRQSEEFITALSDDIQSLQTNSVFTIDVPDNVSQREKALAKIDELLDEISKKDIDSGYKKQLEENKDKLLDLRKKILRIIDVNDESLFVDLGALYEGAKPNDIAIVGNFIYVSDVDRNVIYKIDTDGNVKEIKKDFNSIKSITSDADGDGLLVLDSSSTALGLLDTDNLNIKRFVGMSNDKLSSVIEMDSYNVAKNDTRLYMVTSTTPQVQYINKRGRAYSDGPKKRWQEDELSGVTDLSLLNGKFIFLKPGTGILRYYSTSRISTIVSGLLNGDNLNSAEKLAVDATKIYVADSINRRIIVLTAGRDGNDDYLDLIAQYKSANIFSDIKDIIVGTNYLYVLDDSKVFKLDLNSLQQFQFN